MRIINILLDNYLYAFFRPEFIEFFGLHATSSNGSPMLVEGASTSCNGNDTAAKGNDEDMDDSPGPVIKHESFSFFLLFIILI